jgi:lipopolysaccharide biosynthesis glycosyltransferase
MNAIHIFVQDLCANQVKSFCDLCLPYTILAVVLLSRSVKVFQQICEAQNYAECLLIRFLLFNTVNRSVTIMLSEFN